MRKTYAHKVMDCAYNAFMRLLRVSVSKRLFGAPARQREIAGYLAP